MIRTLLLGATATRTVFWHMDTTLRGLWYTAAGLSVLVFVYGIARPLAKYRRGRPGGVDVPARKDRTRWAVRAIWTNRTVARRSEGVGWAHRLIFYGFLTLFAGTVILGLDIDVLRPLFGRSFFHGPFYLGYSFTLDVLGVALIAGLAVMMVRRGVVRPARLDYARPDRNATESQYDRRRYVWGDWAFLVLLMLIAVTGYLLEGVRIAMDRPGDNWFEPVGWSVSVPLATLGHHTLSTVRVGLWWFHGLIAIAFVAAIPYTKASHMLASSASLFVRDPNAGRRMARVAAEAPVGYATVTDFTPRHLLQLDACTKCGKCHEVCPARAAGLPLSPRDVVLELREQANASFAPVGIGGVLGILLDREPGGTESASVIGEDRVKAATVWSCMQCNACVEICPVGIEQGPIIAELRRGLVDEGKLNPNLQETLETIHRSGNSFGESRRTRGRWVDDLEFSVKDARTQAVDVLWFVGDYASFDPRNQTATRALARLLRAADIDFGILYDGERNAGNDVRRIGEEGLFEMLAEENVKAIKGCTFDRIMTSDPHSLNTIRNEYPAYGGEWQVEHHTALLLDLLGSGKLSVTNPIKRRVTYHDPCNLGRLNGSYEPPRDVMRAIGCELIEMPRNRDNSFCCGAGGGRIWIPDEPGQRRPSVDRIDEAIGLGGLDHFVVSCPKDVTMYEDAVKTSGNQGVISVREISELVEEAVTGTRSPVHRLGEC